MNKYWDKWKNRFINEAQMRKKWQTPYELWQHIYGIDYKEGSGTVMASKKKPKRVKRKTNRLTSKEIRELIKKKKRRGITWEC